MDTTLEGLVASATGDSADAEREFDRLLVSQGRRLYGIAYSILRDSGEADDAVQEAMLKAWRKWPTVHGEDRRAAWLTKICVNHCINRRKSLRNRLARVLPVRDSDRDADDPRFQGRLLDLDMSYTRLSPKQRAAIFLHYHHGYSIDECAELMACSSGSVRTHLARAIASMRKGMSHD